MNIWSGKNIQLVHKEKEKNKKQQKKTEIKIPNLYILDIIEAFYKTFFLVHFLIKHEKIY